MISIEVITISTKYLYLQFVHGDFNTLEQMGQMITIIALTCVMYEAFMGFRSPFR
jgi:hypothetical protein